MATKDTRRMQHHLVYAKATHVLNEAEARRRFGSVFKHTMVMGFVLDVKKVKTATGKRSNTMIHIFFPIDDKYFKDITLNLKSVQRVPPERQLPPEHQQIEDINEKLDHLLKKIRDNMSDDGTRNPASEDMSMKVGAARLIVNAGNAPTNQNQTTSTSTSSNLRGTTTARGTSQQRENTTTTTTNINHQEGAGSDGGRGDNPVASSSSAPPTNQQNNNNNPPSTSSTTENENSLDQTQQERLAEGDEDFFDATSGQEELSLGPTPSDQSNPPSNTSSALRERDERHGTTNETRPPTNITATDNRSPSENSSVTNNNTPPLPPLPSPTRNNNDNNNNSTTTSARRGNIFAPQRRTRRNQSRMDPLDCHGQRWVENDLEALRNQNGTIRERVFKIISETGFEYKKNCQRAKALSRLEWFLLSFPPAQLAEMVRLTNKELAKIRVRNSTTDWVTQGELVKFLGMLMLMTRFEFNDRASLWKTTSLSKYVPAPAFGRTGMSRNRFDTLWRCLRWSEQASVRPDGVSHAEHRWQLVDGFVERFNEYRKRMYSPTHMICVDESMIRWYGIGGSYINMGLPQYVDMDRKPEKGGEIQNAADGITGVMLNLHIVKGTENERLETLREENEDGSQDGEQGDEEILHGSNVMLNLVRHWWNTKRVVCADSYFASVPAAKLLYRHGLLFIGVVKTATKEFPMAYLSEQVLTERGSSKCLVNHKEDDDDADLIAMVWMDRDRRYFISSASSANLGNPCVRTRWRQIDEVSTNSDPNRMELNIPQPEICEHYYSACGKIDMHNRCRQDDLNLEKK